VRFLVIGRPYLRGSGRRFGLGRFAAAGSLALLISAHGPPAASQLLDDPLPRGSAEELPCHTTIVQELATAEIDELAFALQEGDAFIVDAIDVSGSIELLRLRLIGPDGHTLGNTCTGRIQQRAPVSGIYRLEVKDCIGADSGRYSLSLNLVSDTPRNCAVPLGCDKATLNRLEIPGQVDSFSFYGASGEPVSLDFESTLERRGGLEVRVYDPSGIAVLQTCGDSFDFNLPVTGRYTILVNSCLGKNTGVYSASWRSRSCPTHLGAHSGGGAIGLRLGRGESEITQLAASNLSCAYGETSGFVLDFNPPLPIVDGHFSGSAMPQDALSNTARLVDFDGAVVDDDGTQLIGGMSVRFNAARCNFQWTATSEDDRDWDGWSNDVEDDLGSRAADMDSTAEDHEISTSSLFGPGVCRDRFDNDGDGLADGDDPGCSAPLPIAPAVFSSFAGRHSGGAALALERSADGSRLTRLMTPSISCGTFTTRALMLDVDIPVSGSRFFASNILAGGGNPPGGAAAIDGVFFDGDGDGTREQALGILVLRFGEQCRFKWWASAHPDHDGDGWGDAAERSYGADERPFPGGLGLDSTPEDQHLPTSNLGDTGTCADLVDNDGNGLTDSADPKCALPTPTFTRTPTTTPSRTPTPTRTATSSASATMPVNDTPTRTLTPTISPTSPSLPTSTASPVPTSTPSPSATRPPATSTSTPPPSHTATPPAPTTAPTTPSQVACTGEGPIRALRSLPARFRPGEEVLIRLDLDVDEAALPRHATIIENLPKGWTLVAAGPPPTGEPLEGRQVRWMFSGVQIGDDGMDVNYTLRAPAHAVGPATFCGGVEYTNAGGDRGCLTLGCAVLPRASLCPGDCDGNGVVGVNEVLLQVAISLGGAPLASCPAGDTDGNGAITVNEVLATVNTALSGCSG
jgi:hypothetical protein